MKKLLKTFFVLAMALLPLLVVAGCYQRSTADTYGYGESEVKRIREQLGAQTGDQEFTNLEEEEDE